MKDIFVKITDWSQAEQGPLALLALYTGNVSIHLARGLGSRESIENCLHLSKASSRSLLFTSLSSEVGSVKSISGCAKSVACALTLKAGDGRVEEEEEEEEAKLLRSSLSGCPLCNKMGLATTTGFTAMGTSRNTSLDAADCAR